MKEGSNLNTSYTNISPRACLIYLLEKKLAFVFVGDHWMIYIYKLCRNLHVSKSVQHKRRDLGRRAATSEMRKKET